MQTPDFSRYLLRWDRYTTAEVERMSKETNLNFFNYFFGNQRLLFDDVLSPQRFYGWLPGVCFCIIFIN